MLYSASIEIIGFPDHDAQQVRQQLGLVHKFGSAIVQGQEALEEMDRMLREVNSDNPGQRAYYIDEGVHGVQLAKEMEIGSGNFGLPHFDFTIINEPFSLVPNALASLRRENDGGWGLSYLLGDNNHWDGENLNRSIIDFYDTLPEISNPVNDEFGYIHLNLPSTSIKSLIRSSGGLDLPVPAYIIIE